MLSILFFKITACFICFIHRLIMDSDKVIIYFAFNQKSYDTGPSDCQFNLTKTEPETSLLARMAQSKGNY